MMSELIPHDPAEMTPSHFGTVDIGGVPVPVSVLQNTAHVVSRLLTSAIAVPEAWLSAIKANIDANSKARTLITSATAKAISKGILPDDALSRQALLKAAERMIGKQVNLDKIGGYAIAEVVQSVGATSEETKSTSALPLGVIDDEWINAFADEASQKTSEEVQRTFGRILAGEIQQPGKFSVRTIRLLGQMDSHVAGLFRRLCSMSIALVDNVETYDARVLILMDLHGDGMELSKYGLRFRDIIKLIEYGLVRPELTTIVNYVNAVVRDQEGNPTPTVGAALYHLGKYWELENKAQPFRSVDTKLPGFMLSNAGIELLDIVELEPIEEYEVALHSFFNQKGLAMVDFGSLSSQ